jgi:CheY-like chemotaxis protein
MNVAEDDLIQIGTGGFDSILVCGIPREKKERQAICNGTVLVVDDEPALRMLAKAILERSGYEVLIAEDGRQGVEMFRRYADIITTVLLDLTMPVMSGEEAFRLIREIRAEVPIVVSTGYSEGATEDLFRTDTMAGFVQKPYSAAMLCDRIRTTGCRSHLGGQVQVPASNLLLIAKL